MMKMLCESRNKLDDIDMYDKLKYNKLITHHTSYKRGREVYGSKNTKYKSYLYCTGRN